MIDSTPTASGAVVDECPARPSQLVVEADAGRQAKEALQDALAQTGQGARPVALQGEHVLAGPEDRLDALADRRELWVVAGFVLASRAHDRGVALGDGDGELAAGVALVAEQRLAAAALAAIQQHQPDVALVELRRGQFERAWGAVGREDRVQPEAPEKRECDAHQP